MSPQGLPTRGAAKSKGLLKFPSRAPGAITLQNSVLSWSKAGEALGVCSEVVTTIPILKRGGKGFRNHCRNSTYIINNGPIGSSFQ